MILEKYHGCGNDFLIMKYKKEYNLSLLAQTYCNRRLSIGADGMIFFKTNPLEMIIYNSDGTIASMCGNGIRCLGLYLYNHSLLKEKKFSINTLAGIIKLEIKNTKPFLISINLGKPIFDNQKIDFDDSQSAFGYYLKIDNKKYMTYSVFIGTIHTVIFVDDFINLYSTNLALKISNNYKFKSKTNVDFVKVINEDEIMIRTYEKGVGWTLACGTGACASVIVANRLGFVKNRCKCHFEIGSLECLFNNEVFLEGSAEKVFRIKIKSG